MSAPLASLIATGTKLWLDSVDPQLVRSNKQLGATGATSNPIIISGLLQSGRYDDLLAELLAQSQLSSAELAWELTDRIVSAAQAEFLPAWQATQGNDGYVSFEVDPLLEDPGQGLTQPERVAEYVRLGTQWSAGQQNRMIKVPATPAGIEALTELAARGVPLNVTLIFTPRQYRAAREAIWQGAQRQDTLQHFKSVYSIFISRVDVYTQQHVPELSAEAQGQVGIFNAQQIWQENQTFWQAQATPLAQEIVFASTGTKDPAEPPWKYVAALAGSDIQTNPPATNAAVQESGRQFHRTIDSRPPAAICQEIADKIDWTQLEETLLAEGIQKFVDPQVALLRLVADKCTVLS